MQIRFFVNGKEVELSVSPKRRLLDILREDLDLVGTKEGCGKGECGACTVVMNGLAVNSCLVPAFQLDQCHIFTIEGLRERPWFPLLERAYVDHGAVQCGFCTTGFVMSTAALLANAAPPLSLEQIKWQLAGNICRCTGYAKILAAVMDLSQQQSVVNEIKLDWQSAIGGR